MALTVLLQQMQHEYGVAAVPITSKAATTTTTAAAAATRSLLQTAETAGFVTKNANQHEMELETIMKTTTTTTTKKLTETKTFEDAATATSTTTTNYKTRLRKRHSHSHSFRANYRHEMNSQEMEWTKSCGGVWEEQTAQHLKAQQQSGNKRCLQYKKLLRNLQHDAGREYRKLHMRTATDTAVGTVKSDKADKMPAIDISKMRMWAMHNNTYKFLPVLSKQSNIALRSWHRQLQIYVAAFAYMRRAQLHWDYHHANEESPAAKELDELKQSAHRILCSIESAINNTNIVYGHNLRKQQQQRRQQQQKITIKIITRQQMELKLSQFKTPIIKYNDIDNSASLASVDPTLIAVDIKFLKHHYIHYLRNMSKNLRKHTVPLCLGTTAAANNFTTTTAGAAAAVTKNEKTERQLLKLKPNNNNNNDDHNNDDDDDIILKPKKSQKHKQRHQKTSHKMPKMPLTEA